MEEPLWNLPIITHFCANCHMSFENNAQKVTQLDVGDNAIVSDVVDVLASTSAVRISILDALLHVYGLSYEDFAQIFPEDVYKASNYLRDIGGQELSLCCKCLQVFKDVYHIHVKFESLSKEDALLQKVIKFKKDKALSMKKEQEFSENNDDSDDFVDLNLDHSSLVPDLEQEIKTEFSELGNNDSINIECIPSLPSLQNATIKIVGNKKKFGGIIPRNMNLRKAANTSRSLNEDDRAFQPHVRLTRSKHNFPGSRRKKNKLESSEDEDAYNSSPTSEFEDEIFKKSVNRRKTLKKVAVETEIDVKPEMTDGGNIEDEDDYGSEGKVSEKFVKTWTADGKRLVYACSLCGETFARLKDFKIHINAHKKEANRAKRMRRRKVKCPTCGKMCRNSDSLEIHQSKRHSDEPRICDICGKTFLRVESLTLHQRYSHSEEKSFECPICGMKYKWKASLVSHQLTHKIARPHVCEKCGVSYTNKSNLNQHYTYHEDEERDKELFRCKECNKLLKNRKSLRSHCIRYHRGDGKMHTCTICGMSTKRKENLTAHMKIHDPDRVLKKRRRLKVHKNENVPIEAETEIQQQFINPDGLTANE